MKYFFPLRGFRDLARLSQDELGRQAGVDRARISRIENGFLSPSKRERRALSKALQVPEEFLFPEKP